MRNRFAIIFVLVQIAVTAALIGGIIIFVTRGQQEAAAPAAGFEGGMRPPQSQPTYRANPARTGYFDSMPVEAFPGVSWHSKDAGSAATDPTAAAGKLYFGNAGNELVCVDTVTHAVLWKYKTMQPIISTPAVQDGAVFFGSDALYALDATSGAVRWRSTAAGEIPVNAAESPVVSGNSVYFAVHDTVYALDTSSGAVLWKFASGDTGLTSPAFDNGTLFFGGSGDMDEPAVKHNLYAVDAGTGNEIWRFEADGSIETSPAVAGGLVFFGASRITRGGGGDPRFASTGSVTGSLFALETETGARRWVCETDSILDEPPAIAGNLLLLTYSTVDPDPRVAKGFIRGLDAETGQEKWMLETGTIRSATAIAGTTAYLVTTGTAGRPGGQASLKAIDILAAKERWSFAMDAGWFRGPLLANDILYVSADGIYAID